MNTKPNQKPTQPQHPTNQTTPTTQPPPTNHPKKTNIDEVEKCIECGNTNIKDDKVNGEIVCIACGLVLGNTEFAPPADRIPKTDPTNPIVYTSSAIGTEIESTQRTELNTTYDINLVIQKLELHHKLEPLAIYYARKLCYKTKQQTNHKIRLTRTELTIWAIWAAIKHTNYPLSADQYTKKLEPLYRTKNLMKIEKRASQFIKNENRIPNTTLVTKHINHIATKLKNTHNLNTTYTNKISNYATQIIQTNPGIITNRKTNLVAASALLAADHIFTNQLHPKTLAEIANTGTDRLAKLAQTYKQYTPPRPKDWASIKFQHYLLKEAGLC